MPTQGTMVQFKAGLYENYVAIATKDLNTIYFCTDTQQMFIGETEYTRPVITGATLPEIDSPLNTMFYHTTEKALYSNIGGTWTKVSNEYVHPNSGATAGTYGQVTINAQGHVTGGVAATDVAHGGTGKTSVTANALLKGNGTSAMAEIAPGTTGQVLKMTASGPAWGADNNTTYTDMKGATASAAGANGLVPAPAAGKQTSFLRGDGTWVVPTNTNTTYTFAEGSTNGAFSVTPSGGSAQSVSIHGLGSAAYKADTYFATKSHTHTKDDITSVNASAITGTISIENLPAGALERLVVVADDAARLKLTTASVQNGDTVKVTSTGKIYYVVDDTKLNAEAGYVEYTAGSATSVPWSGVTGKPSVTHSLTGDVTGSVAATLGGAVSITTTLKNSGVTAGTYRSVTVNAKGIITGGSNPTTLAGYGITDAVSKSSTWTAGQILTADANGVAKTTGFTIATSVPANAKFTDTTYSAMTGATADAAGVAGLVPAPAKGDQAKFLKADGTWGTPTNTTYSGDRGISLVSGKFGHSNAAITANTTGLNTAKTLAWGSAITLNTVKYDAYGHITGTGTYTITMPANPNTDTHHQAKNIVGASATATANAATANTTTFLNLVENGAVRSSHQIKGAGATTVSATAAGVITVTSTDTKLTWGSF